MGPEKGPSLCWAVLVVEEARRRWHPWCRRRAATEDVRRDEAAWALPTLQRVREDLASGVLEGATAPDTGADGGVHVPVGVAGEALLASPTNAITPRHLQCRWRRFLLVMCTAQIFLAK